MAVADPVTALVRPEWAPLRHVRAGWTALQPAERAHVQERVERILAGVRFGADAPKDALLRFFSFLAQVETIAIEIPLRFLPHAKPALRPSLRRQLVDEVVHSLLFARIAHDLARPAALPPAPIESAERLLEKIRGQKDLAITATLLNLAAEGWIETLFRHARTWGVADSVFQAVLEDEARHVHEATDYAENLDMKAAAAALQELEQGLLEVGAEPAVALSMMRVAGPQRYAALVSDLHKNHIRHLAMVGLSPSAEWTAAAAPLDEMAKEAAASADNPQPLDDTPWRFAAKHVWHSPRDPTMKGEFTVRAGHIHRKLITPILVAAVGRAWAKHPEFNVSYAQGKRWHIPKANVGVRVMLASDELATVIIPDADIRSVGDIQRMLRDGLNQLQALRRRQKPMQEWPETMRVTLDAGMASWAPPGPLSYSVSISNVGRFGLESGTGCFTGDYAPSTDLTIGARVRLPVWRGVAYLPAWHLRVGALQDHRVFDGNHAGGAMRAIKEQVSRDGVRKILGTKDTLPKDVPDPVYDDVWFNRLPAPLRAMPAVAFVKYDPVVVGGLAGLTAIGVGVGGYFLIKALVDSSAAAAVVPPVYPPMQQTEGYGGHTGPPAAPPVAAVAGLCTGMTQDGRPCHLPPQAGMERCWHHAR